MREQIEIIFIGKIQDQLIESEARRLGLDDLIKILGFRPKNEALALMRRYLALILVGHMYVLDAVPARLYEYAASGKPTLSFSSYGILHDFIIENELGESVDSSNSNASSIVIVEWFDAFRSQKPLYELNQEKPARYGRRILTSELAQILAGLEQ